MCYSLISEDEEPPQASTSTQKQADPKQGGPPAKRAASEQAGPPAKRVAAVLPVKRVAAASPAKRVVAAPVVEPPRPPQIAGPTAQPPRAEGSPGGLPNLNIPRKRRSKTRDARETLADCAEEELEAKITNYQAQQSHNRRLIRLQIKHLALQEKEVAIKERGIAAKEQAVQILQGAVNNFISDVLPQLISRFFASR